MSDTVLRTATQAQDRGNGESHLGRWKPARAGIRNIWEYDDQVFEFADGRLVLRGPNGSGKSNALALLVPFLLDGVMAANRMDSLSGGRSMKTLLLCLAEDDQPGKRFRHEQRTGYVWLELARADEGTGAGQYLTLGCGARASTQRDADAWFFVTPRRPKIDLDLSPGGVPLSRGGLIEALGAAAVFDSAESYRTAVDRQLFGIGSHRYASLVDLLLVLRRPHLAGKLNLDRLSAVLSDGLAALDEQLLVDVAASFDDLEAVQRDLQALQDAQRAVDSFFPTFRRYLQATARQRAEAAINAAKELRAAQRRLQDAEADVAGAQAAIEEIQEAETATEERQEVAEQRHRAVLESPAYRDASQLVQITERASEAHRHAEKAQERFGDADGALNTAVAKLDRTRMDVEATLTKVHQRYGAVAEAADQAGVPWTVAREEVEAEDLVTAVRAGVAQRRDAISEVRDRLRDAERAEAKAAAAIATAEGSAERAREAEERRDEAAAAVDAYRTELASAVSAWVSDTGIETLLPMIHAVELVGAPEAPSLADTLATLLRPLWDDLATRRARTRREREDLKSEQADVATERDRIAAEPLLSPHRAATRPANREGRPGAPLFACCDFADHLEELEQAGLEAALEAAGILDAWIAPGDPASSGDVPPEWDAWIRSGPPAAGAEPTLANVLVATPPDDSGLHADDIRSVLSQVGLADSGIAVLPDGQFTLGPLAGRYGKARAEYIGATAREQLRRQRLAELDARLDELDRSLSASEAALDTLDGEARRLDAATASLPSSTPLLTARDALNDAIGRAKAAIETAERDAVEATEARAEARRAQELLRQRASERRLASTADGLDNTARLVDSYDRLGNDFVRTVSDLAGRRQSFDEAQRQVDERQLTRDKYYGEHEEAARHAAGLSARVEQLQAQLGPDVDAPLRELERIESALDELREHAKELNRRALDATERRGAATKELEGAGEAVQERQRGVDETAARLAVLRRSDIWAVITGASATATAQIDSTAAAESHALVVPSESLTLAQAVVQQVTATAAEPDHNGLQRAYRSLLDDLGRGYDPSLSYDDGVATVAVTSEAGTFSILWLSGELASQVARQMELLSERDREIFERHLLTRVSEALRDLLNDADGFVGRVNECLADRPTASGKSVQLRWEVDASDPGIRTSLSLLRRTPEMLGPDQREQLRRFFSTSITQMRAEGSGLSYVEILRQVLDYRSWHRFVPYVTSAGGGRQQLTRTLYRSLSGGEQAVVLHLPLFAAAAAHYAAADASAPRMIALDEAFAGIDEGMRGELMGLLRQFDLDVMLTGHELWATYAEVPAVMMYDLLRRPPMEGVSAFAARWDGTGLTEAGDP